jgi:hypothetical protein
MSVQFRTHILGYVVRTLREMAAGGASATEILAYLVERTGSDVDLRYDYLRSAFARTDNIFFYVLPPGPLTEAQEEMVAQLIHEYRSVWEAQRFPELMRLRDYFSFLQFAKAENVTVTVCGANPLSGPFIGRRGHHCFDGNLNVVSRETPPNEGLVAADPQDLRLIRMLNRYAQPLSYADYLKQLATQGYVVRGPEDGFVIEDAAGERFYEGYRLHGVYDADSGEPAWTARRGEWLRAALNRRLGNELIRSGPHDDWEYRNDREIAGPLLGPQLPVIEFNNQDGIENYVRYEDMAWRHPYKDRWTSGYPHYSVPTKS